MRGDAEPGAAGNLETITSRAQEFLQIGTLI
jgi:hypothetical protein